MTFAGHAPARSGILETLETGSPALAHAARLFIVLFVAMLALQLADDRLINGVNVWIKPAKFFLSLSLQMATLAWGLSLVDVAIRKRYRLNGAAILFIILASLEMAYMIFRASRGEASHFNHATPLAEILYSLMGLAAVTMMLATGWAGIAMARNTSGLARITGFAFILAALLTIAVGGYLGSQHSHWIGGDPTDATGLPLFGWSTTGGDLRPAHFMAMHIMQFAPLAAILAGPRAGWATMAACVVLTATLFAQAIMGQPLLTP